MAIEPIKPGVYRVFGNDEHLFDVVIREDGTHEIVPKEMAECTVCRQGAGNDCVHFLAR